MVMAKGDEIMEGSVSSLIIESLESNQHEDVISPEDLAWVDSCLVKDPENSDSNWNALKDALLEIVNLQPEVVSYSSSRIDCFSEGTDIEMQNPGGEAETTHLEKNDDDVVPINVESEANDDSRPINKKTSFPLSKLSEADDMVETFVGSPFLPSFKTGKRVSEATDLGLDLDPLAVEIEALSENVFEVWDLNVSYEEDELLTQLNKALAESSSTVNDSGTCKDLKEESLDNLISVESSSTINDSGTWKDLKDESLDNLIAGMSDLSLDPLPS